MKKKNAEKKIWDVERFDVAFNGARKLTGKYKFENQARNNWTVAEWKKSRLAKSFPNAECDVLDGDGNVVLGMTTLATVRDSYSED